jgi:hypothetical protein
MQIVEKSSPATTNLLSEEASTQLISEPSAPCGKTPITSQPSLQVDVYHIEASRRVEAPLVT